MRLLRLQFYRFVIFIVLYYIYVLIRLFCTLFMLKYATVLCEVTVLSALATILF